MVGCLYFKGIIHFIVSLKLLFFFLLPSQIKIIF